VSASFDERVFWPAETRDQREREHRAAIRALPQWTLFRAGWLTPSGHVQGGVYWRVADGCGPTGRDTNALSVLYRAARDTCYTDQPWTIEVLAEPKGRAVTAQQVSLFGDPVAAVRRTDPKSSKQAAAADPQGRSHQRTLILRHLVQHGPSTADDCARVIDRHRSVASTRLNVLRKAGLVEKCGLTDAPDTYGRVRTVELHRATPAGREALS
jgi:DNA-binding MarR family transcriptional regulator